MSPNLAGALLMVASMAAFTINDSFVKLTGGEVPLFQLIFLRGILASLLIYGLARSLGRLHFRFSGRDWRLITLRGASEVAATYFFLSALFHMPIGNITAILQALPLTVTLGSALVFGEPVGWQRMAAIGIGFFGVMLIVRPGAEGFSIWSVYALLSVLCVTVRDLSTRRIGATVPSLAVSLVSSLMVMGAAGCASAFQPWDAISSQNAGLIVAAACFILGGYFFSVQAMRTGEVSFVAPFRYTGLLWAMLAGLIVFGEWPDGLTLAGAGIVVATGLFTFYRERVTSRA